MRYKSKTIKKWQNIIDNRIFNSPIDTGEILHKIKKHRKTIGRLLGFKRSYDNDFRTGEETYGYESLENIYYNLIYISDRCHCSFRLAWLKDLPERIQQQNPEHP